MGKTKTSKIEDISARQVTFSKRRQGLFKKARELSILCEAEVAAVVFSPAGRLHQYSSSNMEDILHKFSLDSANKQHPVDSQDHADLSSGIEEKIKCLRMITSMPLQQWGLEELQRLETKLEAILKNVTSRKIISNTSTISSHTPAVFGVENKLIDKDHRLTTTVKKNKKNSQKEITMNELPVALDQTKEHGKECTTSILPAEMGPGDEETGCSSI